VTKEGNINIFHQRFFFYWHTYTRPETTLKIKRQLIL